MAITPVFACGAECSTVPGHWTNTLGGNVPTIQSAIARNSGKAWRCTLATQTGAVYFNSGLTTVGVSRIYVYLVSLPTASVGELFHPIAMNGALDVAVGFDLTSGKFTIGVATTTLTVGVTTAAAAQWYCFDVRANVSANPWVIDWQIDGVDQGTVSPARAADNAIGPLLGASSANQAFDAVFDDVLYSQTSADYPLGAGHVTGYRVNTTSGTHSTPGDFSDSAGTTIANGDSSGGKLNEATPDTATFVRQKTALSTAYVEYVYATSAETGTPRGVQQVVGVLNVSGTASNNQKAQLYDGTSAADTYALTTIGTTSLKWFQKMWAAAPSTGAWTNAKLKATRIRWGFSTDVNPVPAISYTILEAEFADAGSALSRTATEAPSTADVATRVLTATRSATEDPSTADVATRAGIFARTAGYGYAATILADGPKAYWRGQEPSGTNAIDGSTDGDTGTYHATVTLAQTGPFAGDVAVLYDGSTGYMQAGSTTGIPTGAALRAAEAWFNTSASPATDQCIVSWGSNAANEFFFVAVGPGSFPIHISTWGTDVNFGSGYNDGNWHHLVVVATSATSITVYVDDVSLGAQTVPTLATVLNAQNVRVGSSTSQTGPDVSMFSGKIAEVAIYDYALTSTQIATHYAARLLTGDVSSTTDAAVAAKSKNVSATEAPTSADVARRVAIEGRTVTEAPTSADVASEVKSLHRSTTEAPASTDVATRVTHESRSVIEAPSSADVATELKSLVRSTTEAPATTDVPTRVAIEARSTTEAPTSADAAAAVRTIQRTASEAPSSADTATRRATLARGATEAPASADVASRVVSEPRSVTEAPSSTDAITRSLGPHRTATEAPATADTATRHLTAARTASEAPASADVATRRVVAGRSASEAPSTADSATRTIGAQRSASESPASADVATRVLGASRTASESPATADVATRALQAHRSTTEAPATADVATDTKGPNRSTTEAPSTADVASRRLTTARSASDVPSTADVATRMAVEARAATEAPASVDVATRHATEARSATEAPSTTDAAAAVVQHGSISRFVTEATSTSDGATRSVLLFRAVGEATQSADAATVPAQAPTRVVADIDAVLGGTPRPPLAELLAEQAARLTQLDAEREQSIAAIRARMTAGQDREEEWLLGLISDEEWMVAA